MCVCGGGGIAATGGADRVVPINEFQNHDTFRENIEIKQGCLFSCFSGFPDF